MDISSSTVVGLLTWPEIQKSLVPALRSRPKELNQPAPRRMMVGATAGLALERLNEGGLLTADVSAHTTVDVDVKVVAGTASVLADQTGLVSLLDGALQNSGLVVELTTDVDVRSGAL
jgi:hypothetical protein